MFFVRDARGWRAGGLPQLQTTANRASFRAGKAFADWHWLVAREPPGQVRTTLPDQTNGSPGRRCRAVAVVFGHQLTPQRTDSAGNVALFEVGDMVSPSINATNMARAYQETEFDSQPSSEVSWHRRPHVLEIPVVFVSSLPQQIELPRSTAEELAWLARNESDEKQGQS